MPPKLEKTHHGSHLIRYFFKWTWWKQVRSKYICYLTQWSWRWKTTVIMWNVIYLSGLGETLQVTVASLFVSARLWLKHCILVDMLFIRVILRVNTKVLSWFVIYPCLSRFDVDTLYIQVFFSGWGRDGIVVPSFWELYLKPLTKIRFWISVSQLRADIAIV
jgi:hypothetical protein